MLALGNILSIQAVVKAANASRPSDKRQILSAVRDALGMQEADDLPPARNPTDAVLPVAEAAQRLGKARRTIQAYAAAGLLRGVRTGRSRRLVGIPASEIDAFITRHTQEAATA